MVLKRSWLLCGLVVIALFASCIFDPKEEDKDPPPSENIVRQNLTQRWHVLNNIEFAYANRSSGATVYDELLDENFVFYFSPGDVGGEIPEQWARPDEVSATTGLFLSNQGTPSGPVCRRINLDLQYNRDTMTWVEVIPEDFPDEKWYVTTVFYTFTFEMEPSTTFIATPGAKAQFTVRDVDPSDKELWKLVEFRDLANTP